MTQENNSKLNDLAPIVLFVYNRPWHTRQTVEALQKNELANESELFIYSDGPKNENAVAKVAEVREYIKTIDGFKKITIIERDKNWGLANNVIDGVTKIVNEYGKIIVLEDDLVTSPYFLRFMNEALEFYKDEEKVWHISGWNYPIETDGLDDVFFWRLMNCWGWATWADRWQNYEKNTDRLISEFTLADIQRFNLDGVENFWSQVLLNRDDMIDTWAIYWYATIFKNNGLCLNPTVSFVSNVGHDGSGVHCGKGGYCDNIVLCQKKEIVFVIDCCESGIALLRIKQFYRAQKRSLPARVINKLARMIFGYTNRLNRTTFKTELQKLLCSEGSSKGGIMKKTRG
jgi:hypothetical protein